MSISKPQEAKKDKGIFKNNKVRFIIFCCLIAAVVVICSSIFDFSDAERSERVMDNFYAEEDNTIDCVYFGSSATQRGWVVPEAYHEEGVASYAMSCGTQPFVLTRYLMEEVLKTQNPEVFIIELRGIAKSPDDLWDVSVRRMLDNMKMSSTKIDAINAVTEYASKGDNGVDQTKLSYYFPLLKYHSRWNPSKQPHYGGADQYKGYAVEPKVTFKVTEIFPLEYSERNVQPIDPATEAVLRDLLDYCDSIDSRVLFIVSPYEASDAGMGKINYAKEIVEERGYEVLNCLPEQVREEIGLNNKTCYYYREHLNFYGSEKYSVWLSRYLKKNYGVPDRRGEGKYRSWEDEYERLEKNLDGIYSDLYKNMEETIRAIEADTE